jgi:hypothetical protein
MVPLAVLAVGVSVALGTRSPTALWATLGLVAGYSLSGSI